MPSDSRPSEPDRVVPATGYGPNAGGSFSQKDYRHPSAGWDAARSVARVLLRERALIAGPRAVFTMNQPQKGYDCPGCAWPDDRNGLAMDVCENGIKHSAWELTHKRADRDFFANHTVEALRSWSDFALEDVGRLTEPLRYDAATDRYVPISWEDAFALVGRHVRGLTDPNQAAFYSSGRLSNEGAFLCQLWARELGTNNLPDCSNMCHEASGRALSAAIGSGKGTCDLDDWLATDCLILMGVNAASNAPRMLTTLAEIHHRGGKIIHVNPMIEAASGRTILPHDFVRMATFQATPTGSMNVQPRITGDQALLRGVAKHLLEAEKTDPNAIDRVFLDQYTHGFDAYRSQVEATPWAEIVRQSGVPETAIHELAEIYRQSKSAIVAWCLGLTQQEHACDTIREIVNVLLLRGNLGRKGAGPSPIRGHSNVQGNRTCGMNHRPTDAWLARMERACGIRSPRGHGLDTVGVLPAMMKGDVSVFVGVGGNFVRAVPDYEYASRALQNCALTVQISTKLNRAHLDHGRDALVLPCLARTEIDLGRNGPQGVTVEDAMSQVHLSFGMKQPGSPTLRSEVAILCGLASASLPDSKTPWADYAVDYDAIRDTMAQALEGFDDFNRRARDHYGFRIAQPARERVFRTDSGRANFSDVPLADSAQKAGRLLLGTVRSHDQWNTTIYADDDRYRGVKNLRTLVFLNEDDMRDRGLNKYDLVDITSFARDGTTRSLQGYRAIPYDLPRGSAIGYMPEMNVLCAVGDFSPQSNQPLMKHIIVEIEPSRPRP